MVFAAVHLALATVLVARPRWALYPTLALTAQQLWSHGNDLLDSLRGPGPFDVVSLGVCLFFPALLIVERRREGVA